MESFEYEWDGGRISHTEAGGMSVTFASWADGSDNPLVVLGLYREPVLSEAQQLERALYTALREGRPVYELAWELAAQAPEDLGPVVVLLAGPVLSEKAAVPVAWALLESLEFEPDFALAPELREPVAEAFALVERDVRARGLTGSLELTYPEWDDGARAFPVYDGEQHGNGITASDTADPALLLAAVADQVQESIAESWTVWPLCTTHGTGLHARRSEARASWWCTVNGGHLEAPIGSLPAH
ncbi:hypothetical protein GCM10027589_21520 [Actinocorallia lasiicapitis]